MTWEKKRLLIVVKAYPEHSMKHGSVVCTAGITQNGEWIRIYPVPYKVFIGEDAIPKYSIIECELKKATGEKLARKESYRVRTGSIRVVDKQLVEPVDWIGRKQMVLPLLSNSIEELDNRFKQDRTSLGIIKPHKVIDFIHTDKLEIHDKDDRHFQITIEGKKIPILTQIPHIFKYKFNCYGCISEEPHVIQCEDWELLESYRKWRTLYTTPDELWEKIFDKYYTNMLEKRDLYFFMGTHSQFPSWLIIGLFYPLKTTNGQRTLNGY